MIHRRVNITQRIFSIRNYIMANLSLLSGSLIYFIFLTKKCQGINFRTLYRTGSVDALNETYKFRSDSGDFKYQLGVGEGGLCPHVLDDYLTLK